MEKKIYQMGNPKQFVASEESFFSMDVNADIASEILQLSNGNRKLKKDNVKHLSEDMINGEWICKPQIGSIGFNKEGRLKNGHHTLNAVIRAAEMHQQNMRNKGIEVGIDDFIIRLCFSVGCDDKDFEKMDTGASRSVRDSVEMNIEQSYGKYANLFKNVFKLRHNSFPTNCGAKRSDLNWEEYQNIIKTEGEAINDLFVIWKNYKKTSYALSSVAVAEPAIVVSIMYFMIKDCKQDKETVIDFFKKLISERPCDDNKNIEYLRYALWKSKRNRSTDKFKMLFPDFFKMAARTYMGYVRGYKFPIKTTDTKKVNEIPSVIEKEESQGWDYSPYSLKETLLLPFKTKDTGVA